MEEFEYQEELNLCVGRLKEVFSEVSLERLNEVTLSFVENQSNEMIDYNRNQDILYIEKEKFKKSPSKAQNLMKGLLNVITTDKTTKKRFNGNVPFIRSSFGNLITCYEYKLFRNDPAAFL